MSPSSAWIVGVSGLVLDFPGLGVVIRQDMQLAHITHSVGAILFMSLSLGHTLSAPSAWERAIDGMKTGYGRNLGARTPRLLV